MTEQHMPRVSIGLPVYNGEQYLAEEIDSLLAQTFSDFELIISDNASTDRTEEICRRYAEKDSRITYFRSTVNRGAAINFNRVFELAHGEYFKWAAHDDRCKPEFLEKCVAVLDRDPSVVLCFTGIEFIDGNGLKLKEDRYPVDLSTVTRRDLFRFYATGGHIPNEFFGLIRTKILRESPLVGGYVGSDFVMLGLLALNGRFHQVPEVLFQHREHPQRSTLVSSDSEAFTQWYDSSKSGRFAMPFWRRIFENTKSVIVAPLQPREKLVCLWDICRSAYWNRAGLWENIVQIIRRNSRHH